MTRRSLAPSPITGAREHDKVGSARKIHRSLRDHQFALRLSRALLLDGIQGPGLEVQGHTRSLQWIRGVNSLPASETPIYNVFNDFFFMKQKHCWSESSYAVSGLAGMPLSEIWHRTCKPHGLLLLVGTADNHGSFKAATQLSP